MDKTPATLDGKFFEVVTVENEIRVHFTKFEEFENYVKTNTQKKNNKTYSSYRHYYFQFDDKTLDRHSCVLANQRFFGAHTFDKIGEIMVDIFSKFHLSNDNIVSTVIDNGYNFVKSLKEFGCKIKTSNTDSDPEIWTKILTDTMSYHFWLLMEMKMETSYYQYYIYVVHHIHLVQGSATFFDGIAKNYNVQNFPDFKEPLKIFLIDETVLASCFHPTFKLIWIPEHNEIMKNRVKNLCINTAEKYIVNSSHTESSVDNIDDEEFLIFSSQEQCFDSRANLEVVQFFNNKNKALTCLDSYPIVKILFTR
ncbi:Hypothetical protein CINCED_3A019685 [Cinara cedri]|uniref:Uncharacterized protein n=1 Tax=Cinara cedri TaxID=506608 RepID=A0A5E4N0Y8_9HEMI|nr:Hypothetical protein CINCED_3A019685 [Cinara cedri]